MTYDYDALYRETPNALGAANAQVLGFVKTNLSPGARVLDVGCGQGRDALAIARLGHRVVGVDLSPSGIADICAEAEREGLEVTGIVADIAGFSPEGAFDVLLFDRVLHMLPAPERLTVLTRLLPHLTPGGAVLLVDEPRNLPALHEWLTATGMRWEEQENTRGRLFLRHIP